MFSSNIAAQGLATTGKVYCISNSEVIFYKIVHFKNIVLEQGNKQKQNKILLYSNT